MTYPASFRKKVLSYKAKHSLSIRKTAKHFDIGINSVVRWLTKPVPSKTRSKPPTKIPNEALINDVKKHPDDFLYERAERFGVTAWAIGLALRRLNLTRKKNFKTSKSR